MKGKVPPLPPNRPPKQKHSLRKVMSEVFVQTFPSILLRWHVWRANFGTKCYFELRISYAQRALRDRLMSRGKNCLPTVSRQFLTRNYPRPNCLLKCLPNCLSPTREGFLSSFKINPAVRVIARQVRDKNCLAAIFAPRHQSVSSGPLGG